MSARLRYLIVFIALLLILLIVNSVSSRHLLVHQSAPVQSEDTLLVQINMPSGYKTGKGHPHGYHYKLFSDCSQSVGIPFNIVYTKPAPAIFDALAKGIVDIVAVDIRDSSYRKYEKDIVLTRQFGNYAWAVNKNNSQLVKTLNRWISEKEQSGSLNKLYNKYFTSYSLKPYLATMTKRSSLSPYDDLLKQYCKHIDWDWRLLAAVLKQESRFCIGVRSSRGAMGLMQVMESTAAVYGVSDRYSPSENIKAGVLFLKDIKSTYEEMGIDSANVVKFTLAAYNAGQSRIRDCILFAREQGVDASDWDSVAEVVPLMAQPEYYENADYLRHGAFSGRETLAYVREILNTYKLYTEAVLP